MGIPNSINHIVVFRQFVGIRTTLGQLYLNGEYVGYTLEDTLRPDRIKMKHETAIEEGMYEARKYYSNNYKECIAVDNVPNFTHIRIHGGNNHKHTSGCILLGLKRDDTDPENYSISNCRPAMDKLYEMLDDDKKTFVTIINQIGLN